MKKDRLIPVAAVLLAMAGCAPGPAPAHSPGSTQDAALIDMSGVADMRVIHDFAHDLTRPPSVSVSGTVVDEMDVPFAAWMSVCNPTGCQSTTATPDGHFTLSQIAVIDFGLRSHDDFTTSPPLGVGVRLFHPTVAGVTLDAGIMHVPSVFTSVLLAGPADQPQTRDVGDGLSLTFIAKDLQFPLGEPSTAIGARRIIDNQIPPYDVGQETMVAAYSIQPYAITSKSPIAVKAAVQLPPGSEVRFRAVYEFDGKLGTPVIGHASNDGTSVSTDHGLGVDNLTWLLITR